MRSRSRSISLAAASLLAGALLPGAHAADRPAAMVESVSGPIAGVQVMDYLTDGTVVELGAAGVLVVDYLASCVRETITGGTARIGATQSSVERGKISRRRVDCDGAELQLTATQSDQGGVAVFRSALGGTGADGLPQPDLTLRGRAPFITTKEPGTIKIERLDANEPALAISAARTGSGRIGVELAPLAAGGLYRATIGQRSLVFRIAPDAGTDVPLIARLLPL
jgi:hypothetical protein